MSESARGRTLGVGVLESQCSQDNMILLQLSWASLICPLGPPTLHDLCPLEVLRHGPLNEGTWSCPEINSMLDLGCTESIIVTSNQTLKLVLPPLSLLIFSFLNSFIPADLSNFPVLEAV